MVKNAVGKSTIGRRLLNKSASITSLILKVGLEVGFITIDSFFSSRYPQGRMWRNFLGISSSQEFSKQTLFTILWRLKRQGLIEQESTGKWNLTKLGKRFAGKIGVRKNEKKQNQKKNNMLVVFDIPEKERRKRTWLRMELVNYGFNSLQKSVWIGSGPLPQEFILDLDELNLQNYVHIIGIGKFGTINIK